MNKVSVILPVYNVEKYLQKSVLSVRNQTYSNLEIILVDDGSTDNCGRMCDDFAANDNRITVVHKSNGGLASARNAGLDVATGDYIAYVDSDDWIAADFIERMLNCCLKHNAQMAICRYAEVFSGKYEEKGNGKIYLWSGKEAIQHRILDDKQFGIGTCVWNRIYSRSIIQHMKFPEGKYYEDLVYSSQAMANCAKVVYVDSSLYFYRCDRTGSIMNEGFNPRIITDELPLMYERNTLYRDIGLTDIADLCDRNYCIRIIEISRELSNDPMQTNKDSLLKVCMKYFQLSLFRCGKKYFGFVDRFKVFLYRLTPNICIKLLNIIYRKK